MAEPCKPEWCETGTEPHDDVCDNHPMDPMTKREFVEFMRVAAQHGLDGLAIELESGTEPVEAVELAIDAVEEAAACTARIGSCGRGWCHHG